MFVRGGGGRAQPKDQRELLLLHQLFNIGELWDQLLT
jgi:hypothetical protein